LPALTNNCNARHRRKRCIYRIEWPDVGLSPANLTRCRSAALEWAERNLITEHRNLSVAQRLKSLNNFWWSSSYVAPIAAEALMRPRVAIGTGARER
jgi:hypothetical protein